MNSLQLILCKTFHAWSRPHSLWMVFLLMTSFGCTGTKTEEQPPTSSSDTPVATGSFSEMTAAAGLADFRHVTGAKGDKWFPESMGSGGGFIDYNGDGWLDILLVGGGEWPNGKEQIVPALWLYRNNGDETFTQVTADAGLGGLTAYGFGIAVADFDNDGDQDFYFTTLHENMLFRNEGGVFSEIAKTAGVVGESVWSSSATFFDADRDGWLDLYVCNYVEWSPEKDLWCTLDGKTKSYCTPELYQGIPGRFYHNNGDGTFSDQTESAGFGTSPGKSLGVIELDYNRDGWPDLMVANDTQRNLLYKNNGNGTFAEIAAMSGVAYDENGRARAGMGIDAGVVDPSGHETIFVGNFSKEMIAVFQYTGHDLFTDRAAASKIGRPSLLTLAFGLFLFDVEHDGDLDLFVANGHVQEDIEVTQDGITYREPPHLFLNNGEGDFVDAAPSLGGVFTQPLVGRAACYGDYDRDGDVDVLITENGGPLHLWRNDLNSGNHHLRVHVQGKESNRDAIGTRLVAVVDTLGMERRIRAGSSFLASSETVATFGLGQSVQADSLLAYWPNGQVARFGNIKGDREVRLVEGESQLQDHPKQPVLALKH